MQYVSADLLSRLAAEYVIGTLRGPARRRFVRLLNTSLEAQRQVRLWNSHLGGEDLDCSPIQPPVESRQALLRAVGQGRSARPRFRRTAIFLSGLAAAILASVWLGAHRVPLAKHRVATTQLQLQDHYPEVPIYLTEVGIPASSMQWLVSVSADRRHLIVVAGEDFLQTGRHTIELWYQEQSGESPVALGALPMEKDATVSFDLPPMMAHQGTPPSFVISLEPESGTRARLRGPVLDARTALDLI